MYIPKYWKNVRTFTVFLLLFIFVRLPFIASPFCLNPDEAELIATGKRAMFSIVPYRSFSTSTSGVWWPTILGLLGRIGFPLNLKGAHLLSAILGAAVCYCVFVILKRIASLRNSWLIALLVAVPWASGFSLFSSHYVNDFSGLATELLPLTFLAICVVLYKTADSRISRYYLALVFSGLAIFSKYQLLLVGLFTAGYIIFELMKSTRTIIKVLLISLAAVLGPTLLAFLLAAIFNDSSYTYKEPFYLLIDYLRVRSVTGEEIPLLSRVNSFVANMWALPSILLATVLVTVGGDSPYKSKQSIGSVLIKWSKTCLGFTIAILSIMIPGIGIAHYLHLLIAGLLITLLVTESPKNELSNLNTPASGSFVLFLVGVLSMATFANQIFGTESFWNTLKNAASLNSVHVSLESTPNRSDEIIPQLCPEGSEVLVWGWSADFYSYFNWIPATRYTIQAGMITGSSQPWNSQFRDMRKQLTEELMSNRPRCIVNAVGSGFFPYVFLEPQKIQNQLTGVADFLRDNYEKHEIPTIAVSTYIHRQDFIEIHVLK